MHVPETIENVNYLCTQAEPFMYGVIKTHLTEKAIQMHVPETIENVNYLCTQAEPFMYGVIKTQEEKNRFSCTFLIFPGFHNHLIFVMGIPIPGKTVCILKQGPVDTIQLIYPDRNDTSDMADVTYTICLSTASSSIPIMTAS